VFIQGRAARDANGHSTTGVVAVVRGRAVSRRLWAGLDRVRDSSRQSCTRDCCGEPYSGCRSV